MDDQRLVVNECKSLLKDHPILEGVSDAVLDGLVKVARPQEVSKGQVLFLQEDEAEHVFLVINGWVKVFRETLDGEEAVIDVITRGHMIGEGAIFNGGQHNAGAAAVEPSLVMQIPIRALEDLINQNSDIAVNMLHMVSRQRRRQNHEIESLTLQNASQRIGCFLLRLLPVSAANTPEDDITLHLPYDKSLIASRLGMKSETFSRALGRLKSETGIGVRGGTITIPGVVALTRYSCSACSTEFPCKDMQ